MFRENTKLNMNGNEHVDLELITIIIVFLATLLVGIVGIFLNIKIIKVSLKEKEITWKLDVSNSVVLIVHFSNLIFTYVFNYGFKNAYWYPGEWFCQLTNVSIYLGVLSISQHSLIISSLKYLIIVHWENVRNYGREKMINMFLWINLMHPWITVMLHLCIRPTFFNDYDEFAQFHRCFGVASNITESRSSIWTFEFCDFSQPSSNDYFDYSIYFFRTTFCGLHIVLLYVVTMNILEAVFYIRIFRLFRR